MRPIVCSSKMRRLRPTLRRPTPLMARMTLPAPLSPRMSDDILTYSLSGADKDAFVIVGSIEHPLSYDPDGEGTVADAEINAQGALVFKSPASLNYEDKREYRVTVTATDPSGEHDSVNVIVNITDVNEGPKWMKNPGKPVYAENGTADVAVYLAEDPEKSGVIYSLVTEQIEEPADPL